MKILKLNRYNSKCFLIYNNIRIENISSFSEVNIKSSYNLIKMDNRDGFVLDDKNSIEPLTRQVTFYTKDLKKIRDIFKLNKMVDIYFNNTKYFYRGFTENINYKYFKNLYYEVVINLILQPYVLAKENIITLTGNGTIENIGELPTYPIMEVKPTSKEFSISINKKTMKFYVNDSLDSKYIIDLDKIEITRENGSLKNSIFSKDSDFLFLDVGLNPVIIKNISEVKFRINWRYLMYDLFEK